MVLSPVPSGVSGRKSASLSSSLSVSPSGRRKPKEKKSEIVPAEQVTTFSLSSPPPFDVRAAERLTSVLSTIPTELQCRASRYEVDATSKDAVLLVTHGFWYAFVSLQLPDLTDERDQLLRLMALQYARLTLSVTSSRDAFFHHFPLLAAHAVLAALRRHSALGDLKKDAKAEGPAAAGVFRHMVSLLGGRVPPSDVLRAHMRYAEKAFEDQGTNTAADKAKERFHVPWDYEPTPGAPQPPLAPPVILPLPPVERAKPAEEPPPAPAGGGGLGALGGLFGGGGQRSSKESGGSDGAGGAKASSTGTGASPLKAASSWSSVKLLTRGVKAVETAQITRSQSTNDTGLAVSRSRAYRPARVAVDLRRQSPMVAIYTGADPAAVLETASLAPLQPARRCGFGARTDMPKEDEPLLRKGPYVRQSVPGYGGKTKLGGKSSFQAMQPAGTVEKARKAVAQMEQERQFEDTQDKIFEAAMLAKCDEIDRDCNARLAMPPPQLADYSLALAQQVLHPDPIADF